MYCKALVDYVQYWTGDAYLGRDINLTGLTRGNGSKADPDEDPSGREKLHTDLEEYQPLPISLPGV